MSNNFETIEKIKEHGERIVNRLASRNESSFKIKDLQIDNGIFLNETPLSGSALKSVLRMLNVRSNFLEYANTMSEQDWTDVSDKLKKANGETQMFAKTVREDNGSVSIIDIYRQNESKKKKDDASYSQYFSWLTDSLTETPNSYNLKDFHWDDKKETVNLTLLNNDASVDVFGTDIDVWKLGNNFTFNAFSFNYAPFFERLVCSNGNVAREYGFGANISQNRFNNQKIKGIIEKNIIAGNDTLAEQLQKSVQHLKNNNISLNEFYQFKNFFESRNENEKYNGLLSTYFNEKPFFTGYGENIAQKSTKWKSTANSGINAYDFFNMLTWVASHPEQVKVSHKDRTDLQIKASSLLFKNELDLEDIATGVKIDYPRIAVMN
jgi:hypothetical protein